MRGIYLEQDEADSAMLSVVALNHSLSRLLRLRRSRCTAARPSSTSRRTVSNGSAGSVLAQQLLAAVGEQFAQPRLDLGAAKHKLGGARGQRKQLRPAQTKCLPKRNGITARSQVSARITSSATTHRSEQLVFGGERDVEHARIVRANHAANHSPRFRQFDRTVRSMDRDKPNG